MKTIIKINSVIIQIYDKKNNTQENGISARQSRWIAGAWLGCPCPEKQAPKTTQTILRA